MGIVEFLTARYDEDAAAVGLGSEPSNWCDRASGVHYEPARALADIAAHRAIVEWHQNWPGFIEKPSKMVVEDLEPKGENSWGDKVLGMTYRMEREYAWTTQEKYRATFGDEPPTAPTLRMLAAVYRDHPDYDPEWSMD